jgi:ankyrin repeat protein
MSGSVACVQMLIDRGAQLTTTNYNHQTALHIAFEQQSSFHIVAALLAAGGSSFIFCQPPSIWYLSPETIF